MRITILRYFGDEYLPIIYALFNMKRWFLMNEYIGLDGLEGT